jgi:hypothetical protein
MNRVSKPLPDGFRIVASSRHTMLAVRGQGVGEPLKFRLPSNVASIGPWLLAELAQADADLKKKHPKPKDYEAAAIVHLCFAGGQAHVVPADDPERQAAAAPRYLMDGLGCYPSELRWEHTGPLVIRAMMDSAYETRYWIARIVTS